MRILGILLLVMTYGSYNMISGTLKDSEKQTIFGIKLLAGGLLAMMVLGAFVLIFGGDAS